MNSKVLRNAPTEKNFFAANGSMYANLYQLFAGLHLMDEHTFWHHVSHDKNDFANWVQDVFGHQKLARALALAPDRRSMADILEEHIKELQKKIGPEKHF